MRKDGCSRRRRVALVLVAIWLSGGATVSSDVGGQGTCPPVVEYSSEFQARAAEELALMPEGSVIAEMLSDYAVMRAHVRACGKSGLTKRPRKHLWGMAMKPRTLASKMIGMQCAD